VTEVRLCHRCQSPAAVSVRRWEPAGLFGQAIAGRDPRHDFVCQECGACFSVEPWKLRLVSGGLQGSMLFVVGGLLVVVGLFGALETPGVGLGVAGVGAALALIAAVYFPWAVRPAWVAWTRPVVDNAPPPQIRYTHVEPVRRCTCGEPVACAGISTRRSNTLPAGTQHQYACSRCGQGFAIASPWRLALTTGASLVACGIAPVLALAGGGRLVGNWLCGGVVLLLGLAGLLVAVHSLGARLRHPLVSPGTHPQER